MTDNQRIAVTFAADNVQAMPLGVAIASVLSTRADGKPVDVHVLSCGISESNRTKIASQFDGRGDRLVWHKIAGADMQLLQDLFTSSNRPYPPAAYARLLIGRMLRDVDRAIYLDTDVIVTRDLQELWEIPFDGNVLHAVHDLPSDSNQVERLQDALSQEDNKRYGVDPSVPYFQSGVLVFNLAALRDSGVDEVIDCLRKYPDLTFPDQDALNIVYRSRFRLIDPRWNQMAAVYWEGAADSSPYDPALFETLVTDPYIIHYSGRPKPWEEGCTHVLAHRWNAARDVSAWSGWKNTPLLRFSNKAQRIQRVLRKKLRRLLP